MKAIVTFGDRGDQDRFSKIGLRLISEGAHDVALMELLEERCPGISRNATDRVSTLDLAIPLPNYDNFPSGGSLPIDSDVRITPDCTAVITATHRGQSIIRRPIIVIGPACPGPLEVYLFKVNGREYRPEWTTTIEDIVPGASVAVYVCYRGKVLEGEVFGCVIQEK